MPQVRGDPVLKINKSYKLSEAWCSSLETKQYKSLHSLGSSHPPLLKDFHHLGELTSLGSLPGRVVLSPFVHSLTLGHTWWLIQPDRPSCPRHRTIYVLAGHTSSWPVVENSVCS